MKRHVELLTRSLFVVMPTVMSGCSGGEEGLNFEAENAASASESLVARPKPRLLLTESVLQRLQQRAAAGDAAWKALEGRCEAYTSGTMYAPSGNAYPSYPNVGQGYQGEGYLPVIR